MLGVVHGSSLNVLEDAAVKSGCRYRLKCHPFTLQQGVKAHSTNTNRTLKHCRINSLGESHRSVLDKELQHVVQHLHEVWDELRVSPPLIPAFQIDRRQAAHSGTLLVCH